VDVLLWIFLSFLIFVAVAITAAALIVRALYRRLRRNRALAGTALKTRAGFSRGPHRKVLLLRVRLAETLDSGKAAVELAAGSEGPRGELPRLFRRIQEESVALDLQLRLLESETDAAVLAEELPAAGHRVDQVAELVRRLRSAVASGLAGSTDDTLTTLHADVDREVAALHAGVQELHRLNRRDERFESTRPPARDRRQATAATVRDKGIRP
jgi:hypothetical protein